MAAQVTAETIVDLLPLIGVVCFLIGVFVGRRA